MFEGAARLGDKWETGWHSWYERIPLFGEKQRTNRKQGRKHAGNEPLKWKPEKAGVKAKQPSQISSSMRTTLPATFSCSRGLQLKVR